MAKATCGFKLIARRAGAKTDSWLCGLSAGHSGDHMALRRDGKPHRRWPHDSKPNHYWKPRTKPVPAQPDLFTKEEPATPKTRNLRRLVVDVTPQVIETAKRCDMSYCLVSAALRQTYPWAINIKTTIEDVRLTDPETGRRYTFPQSREGQRYVVNFDAGLPIQPFRSVLSHPHIGRSGRRYNGETRTNIGKTLAAGKKRVVQGANITHKPTVVGPETPPQSRLAKASTDQTRIYGHKGLAQLVLNALEDAKKSQAE